MSNIKILMASHLGSEFRYFSIKKSLESIKRQTISPHSVLISYSYELEKPNTQEWVEILHPIPLLLFEHNVKTSQFSHYTVLSKHIDNNDIICFLDDDDLCSDITELKQY